MLDCCDCLFADSQFMRTLSSFKDFMSGDSAPTYVRRYCGVLDDSQWEWFYAQMKAAVKVTDELDYLFYVLKWILKYDFDDLVYEMYCQDVFNPECRNVSLIKSSRWARCAAKYHERFELDFSDLWAADDACVPEQEYADTRAAVDGCGAWQDLPF